MLRNVKTHLSKDDAAEFTKRFRSIKNAWNSEVGGTQFEELCQRFEKSAPTFVKELVKSGRTISSSSTTLTASDVLFRPPTPSRP